MTIPPVTHAFIANPNPQRASCVRCGLPEPHPIHQPTSTSEAGPLGATTTSEEDGW